MLSYQYATIIQSNEGAIQNNSKESAKWGPSYKYKITRIKFSVYSGPNSAD